MTIMTMTVMKKKTKIDTNAKKGKQTIMEKREIDNNVKRKIYNN